MKLAVIRSVPQLGPEGAAALDQLLDMLIDTDEEIRREAAIAVADLVVAIRDSNSIEKISILEEAIPKISEAEQKHYNEAEIASARRTVQYAIDYLSLSWQYQIFKSIREFTSEYTKELLIFGGVLAWIFVVYLTYRFFPKQLVSLCERLRRIDVEIPIYFGKMRFSVAEFLLVKLFAYSPRCLAIWTAHHASLAGEKFENLSFARLHQIRVDLPVRFEDEIKVDLDDALLREFAKYNRNCMLITGEGGSGKSNFACEIGRRILKYNQSKRANDLGAIPIVFADEPELTCVKDQSELLSEIGNKMLSIIDAPRNLSNAFVTALIRAKRIWIIVDGFSEFGEDAQKKVVSLFSDLVPGVLIITARNVEEEFSIPHRECVPQNIKGNRLSSFIDAYLTKLSMRDTFDDTEFFIICSNITDMIRQYSITVLFMKLYVDQILETHEQRAITREMLFPKGELIENYIYLKAKKNDDIEPKFDEFLRIVKGLAVVSLEKELIPFPFSIQTVSDVVDSMNVSLSSEIVISGTDILEIVQPTQINVRFALDPVAEYLASLSIIDEIRQKKEIPKPFVRIRDLHQHSPHNGFLLAIKDCIRSLNEDEGVYIRDTVFGTLDESSTTPPSTLPSLSHN